MQFLTCISLITGMVKLYLLGGENTARQNAKEVNCAAFADAGGSPSVLIFPWARASFDYTYLSRRRLRRYFKRMGARYVHFVDYSESIDEIAAEMAQSELVYLTGGQRVILMSRLKAKGVDGLLLRYNGVIVGRSAGALVLAKQGVVTNRYTHMTKLSSGLGLVNLCLKVHYDPSKDEALKYLSKEKKIYAIPERAAIICNGDNMSFLGTIFLFENGKKQVVSRGANLHFPTA